ncbi:MAG: zinc carboxypeptidase, partial [Bacteroidota bacterium]
CSSIFYPTFQVIVRSLIDSVVIPTEQPQYTLIKAMFERRTTFQDSLFYDVSSWTLPLAFGVDHTTLSGKIFNRNLLGEVFNRKNSIEGSIKGDKSDYAYVFEWFDYYGPKLLYGLLKKGYRLKVANEPFYNEKGRRFERGSILLSVGIQDKDPTTIHNDLMQMVKETCIDIHPFNTGLDYRGVSLGSPKFSNIDKPKIALLVEGGVTSYDAGEIWHLLDQRYDIDLTLMPLSVFNRADLKDYTTIIMVSGNYNAINKRANDNLKRWVENGGTLIVSKNAIRHLSKLGVTKFQLKKKETSSQGESRRYADIDEYRGAQRIGGAIFETNIDTTHPLLYGYYKSTMPIFRNSEIFLEKSTNPYANPIVYSGKTLLSGYISKPNLEMLKNSSAVGIVNLGRGKVIGFTDNLNFRAFWYGTNKVFMNAVFFGPLLSNSASR